MSDAPAPRRRAKSLALLGLVLSGGLALIGVTQTWFDVTLADSVGSAALIVAGQQAASPISSLALVGLALTGALAIAGRVFRYILGVLTALVGVGIAASAVSALADPVLASASSVTEHTGIAGHSSIAALIDVASPTPWPFIVVAAGVLLVVIGLSVLLTAGRWPGGSRRYEQASAHTAEDPEADTDPVISWDNLSRGEDPTR